jgi:hypothetical protein
VGGRAKSDFSGEYPIELGASMAITQNRYVSQFADQLNLTKVYASGGSTDRGSGKLAIISTVGGVRAMSFVESDWTLVTIGTLLYRYGVTYFYNLRAAGS